MAEKNSAPVSGSPSSGSDDGEAGTQRKQREVGVTCYRALADVVDVAKAIDAKMEDLAAAAADQIDEFVAKQLASVPGLTLMSRQYVKQDARAQFRFAFNLVTGYKPKPKRG